MCKENYHLFKCKQFRELFIDQHKKLILRHHRSFKCLTPGHKSYNRSSKYTCGKYHRKHNEFLLIEFKSNSSFSSTMQGAHHTNLNDATVYFWIINAIFHVKVHADNGWVHLFRVFLDQGSESFFISEGLVQILNSKYQRINTLFCGVWGELMSYDQTSIHAGFSIITLRDLHTTCKTEGRS